MAPKRYVHWLISLFGGRQYLYEYNCDNPSFNSSERLYSPLTTSPIANNSSGSITFGVWYDEAMISNEQADGTNVLITNRASSSWPSSDVESSLYWHDSDDAYNFYEQYDLNQVDEEDGKNHSGRQDFEKMRFTFNIGANNYDQTEGTGQFDFNQNTVHCFIETL